MIKFFSLVTLAAIFTGSMLMAFVRTSSSKTDNPMIVAVNTDQPEELGLVHWLRDLDTGKAEAEKTGKPMLILFQEVPGCSNCTRYGNVTLSHPLIVEAIETFFVPVCIYNNKGGKDGEALRTFNEPSWNNPVVRVVGSNYEDIVPRISNFNSPAQLVRGMRSALQSTGQSIPAYVDLLQEELLAREAGLETATFSMYCFWSGEATFGSIPGVIETEPGFQDGKEVVKVQFNPAIVKKADLETLTQPKGIQVCSRNGGFRSDRAPKYYLAQTDYKYVPMTPLQACRANVLVHKNRTPDEILSPRQLSVLEKVRQNPKRKFKNAIGTEDLKKAWAEI